MSSSTLEINLDYLAKGKQRLFHQTGAKYRLYIGAWRSGKTYAGCYEALKQSLLYPKNCGLIGRKDFSDLRDTTIKTFFEVCPQELIQSYNKTEHHLILKNGSEILFRELKDMMGLGSLNLGWFYIDEAEEVTENIFNYLQGRLSLKEAGCRGWITSNPPNENHWIFHRFEQTEDPDYFTIHASTYENKEHLPVDYITSLEKMPPSWRKKYLEGQYGFTPDGKAFYEGFNEQLHTRQLKPILGKPLILGWDYGWHHPACLITQLDHKGRLCILRENLGADIVIDKYADVIKGELNTRYPNFACFSYGDPAGKQRNDKRDELTSEIILRQKGFAITSKFSTYRERKEIIEKKLSTVIEGIPALVIDESCKTVIDGFMGGYHYPQIKPGQEITIKTETPFKDGFYEHLMNCLEYIIVNTFKTIERANEKVLSSKRRALVYEKTKARSNAGLKYGRK